MTTGSGDKAASLFSFNNENCYSSIRTDLLTVLSAKNVISQSSEKQSLIELKLDRYQKLLTEPLLGRTFQTNQQRREELRARGKIVRKVAKVEGNVKSIVNVSEKEEVSAQADYICKLSDLLQLDEQEAVELYFECYEEETQRRLESELELSIGSLSAAMGRVNDANPFDVFVTAALLFFYQRAALLETVQSLLSFVADVNRGELSTRTKEEAVCIRYLANLAPEIARNLVALHSNLSTHLQQLSSASLNIVDSKHDAATLSLKQLVERHFSNELATISDSLFLLSFTFGIDPMLTDSLFGLFLFPEMIQSSVDTQHYAQSNLNVMFTILNVFDSEGHGIVASGTGAAVETSYNVDVWRQATKPGLSTAAALSVDTITSLVAGVDHDGIKGTLYLAWGILLLNLSMDMDDASALIEKSFRNRALAFLRLFFTVGDSKDKDVNAIHAEVVHTLLGKYLIYYLSSDDSVRLRFDAEDEREQGEDREGNGDSLCDLLWLCSVLITKNPQFASYYLLSQQALDAPEESGAATQSILVYREFLEMCLTEVSPTNKSKSGFLAAINLLTTLTGSYEGHFSSLCRSEVAEFLLHSEATSAVSWNLLSKMFAHHYHKLNIVTPSNALNAGMRGQLTQKYDSIERNDQLVIICFMQLINNLCADTNLCEKICTKVILQDKNDVFTIVEVLGLFLQRQTHGTLVLSAYLNVQLITFFNRIVCSVLKQALESSARSTNLHQATKLVNDLCMPAVQTWLYRISAPEVAEETDISLHSFLDDKSCYKTCVLSYLDMLLNYVQAGGELELSHTEFLVNDVFTSIAPNLLVASHGSISVDAKGEVDERITLRCLSIFVAALKSYDLRSRNLGQDLLGLDRLANGSRNGSVTSVGNITGALSLVVHLLQGGACFDLISSCIALSEAAFSDPGHGRSHSITSLDYMWYYISMSAGSLVFHASQEANQFATINAYSGFGLFQSGTTKVGGSSFPAENGNYEEEITKLIAFFLNNPPVNESIQDTVRRFCKGQESLRKRLDALKRSALQVVNELLRKEVGLFKVINSAISGFSSQVLQGVEKPTALVAAGGGGKSMEGRQPLLAAIAQFLSSTGEPESRSVVLDFLTLARHSDLLVDQSAQLSTRNAFLPSGQEKLSTVSFQLFLKRALQEGDEASLLLAAELLLLLESDKSSGTSHSLYRLLLGLEKSSTFETTLSILVSCLTNNLEMHQLQFQIVKRLYQVLVCITGYRRTQFSTLCPQFWQVHFESAFVYVQGIEIEKEPSLGSRIGIIGAILRGVVAFLDAGKTISKGAYQSYMQALLGGPHSDTNAITLVDLLQSVGFLLDNITASEKLLEGLVYYAESVFLIVECLWTLSLRESSYFDAVTPGRLGELMSQVITTLEATDDLQESEALLKMREFSCLTIGLLAKMLHKMILTNGSGKQQQAFSTLRLCTVFKLKLTERARQSLYATFIFLIDLKSQVFDMQQLERQEFLLKESIQDITYSENLSTKILGLCWLDKVLTETTDKDSVSRILLDSNVVPFVLTEIYAVLFEKTASIEFSTAFLSCLMQVLTSMSRRVDITRFLVQSDFLLPLQTRRITRRGEQQLLVDEFVIRLYRLVNTMFQTIGAGQNMFVVKKTSGPDRFLYNTRSLLIQHTLKMIRFQRASLMTSLRVGAMKNQTSHVTGVSVFEELQLFCHVLSNCVDVKPQVKSAQQSLYEALLGDFAIEVDNLVQTVLLSCIEELLQRKKGGFTELERLLEVSFWYLIRRCENRFVSCRESKKIGESEVNEASNYCYLVKTLVKTIVTGTLSNDERKRRLKVLEDALILALVQLNILRLKEDLKEVSYHQLPEVAETVTSLKQLEQKYNTIDSGLRATIGLFQKTCDGR